jgi:hypothetical protein
MCVEMTGECLGGPGSNVIGKLARETVLPVIPWRWSDYATSSRQLCAKHLCCGTSLGVKMLMIREMIVLR